MIGSHADNALDVFVEVRATQGNGRNIPLPLARARQHTALWVQQVAQECGARAILIGSHHRRAGTAAVGNALWVRWGAGVLLTSDIIRRLGSAAGDGCLWGNRARSADLWAFPARTWPRPGSTPQRLFPRTAATMFRIATAADLCLLATLGRDDIIHTDDLAAAPAILDGIRSVTHVLTKRTAELVVVGDPGAEGWQYLERETACRVRLLGDAPGGVLSSLLASAGAARFVKYLGELGDAFIVNTRILFREADAPTPQDFYHSDLGLVGQIAHRNLRLLTQALLDSGKPVILGGNSLLIGGIYLLVERAWENQELPRQFATLPTPSANPITKE